MKDLLIIIGTIILGAFIFNLMVGNGPNSMRHAAEMVMRSNIAVYGG